MIQAQIHTYTHTHTFILLHSYQIHPQLRCSALLPLTYSPSQILLQGSINFLSNFFVINNYCLFLHKLATFFFFTNLHKLQNSSLIHSLSKLQLCFINQQLSLILLNSSLSQINNKLSDNLNVHNNMI